jgi:hypothetical protein
MDNGRFTGGNRGSSHRFGGVPPVQGSGQGSSVNQGVFQPMNQGFRPGYADRGPYSAFGGGCYGGRGRPGGQPPAHHPGFVAQRGRDGGSVEALHGQVAGQGRVAGGGGGQMLGCTM